MYFSPWSFARLPLVFDKISRSYSQVSLMELPRFCVPNFETVWRKIANILTIVLIQIYKGSWSKPHKSDFPWFTIFSVIIYSDFSYAFWKYTSFKQTVHPNNFEIKGFLLNICLFSGLFQTGKVQTKGGTIEQNVKWQESNSKHLFVELLGYAVRWKRRVNITLQ